ncbi:MAG TPA: di-trans,poly-cis-decaprenylcistransferase, partial [Candidatus Hydrogenedentes bacterium]|nr:di-trans,poly-cis-decaprenylcistransferase [Candidatus Hydrogenedentota bacterium]
MKKSTSLDSRIDLQRIPAHIAIIMDGNGRWAQRNGKTRSQGHEAGARNVRAITEACRELGVRALTLFAFSTENWNRSKREVDSLFRLISRAMQKYADKINETDVRLLHLGELDGLPASVVRDVRRCMELTRNNKAMDVCIALNYGGRMELAQAARKLAEAVQRGELAPEDITEQKMAEQLYIPQ